jgi:hypothetical protein
MKSSFHSLISFLPFLLNHLRLPSPELDPVLDNNSVKWTLLQLNSLNFWQQLIAPLELMVIWPRGWPQGKHRLLLSCIVLGVFTDPLPSNKRPIFARVGSHWKMFTEPLPSNGSISYNIFHILDTELFVSRIKTKIFPKLPAQEEKLSEPAPDPPSRCVGMWQDGINFFIFWETLCFLFHGSLWSTSLTFLNLPIWSVVKITIKVERRVNINSM